MSKIIDGVLKDWGERTDYGRVQGRKGRNIMGGAVLSKRPAQKPLGPATREKVARIVRRAPEVMVKISGGGKNMSRIKAHFTYISRRGKLTLEDEQGMHYHGGEDLRDLYNAWALGRHVIPKNDLSEDGMKRREAFNIVLSMPPGTDRQAVREAAREFAAAQFGTHSYVFVAHEDEKHPHVHLVVKAVDRDGVRLNPRKADLQHWRELFAERMRAHGIEANATPRTLRGISKKSEKQAVRGMTERGAASRVLAGRQAEAAHEAKTGQARAPRGWKGQASPSAKVTARRTATVRDYGNLARALASGDAEDRRLALDIVDFVKKMPPPVTQHEASVAALRGAGGASGVRAQDVQREPSAPRQEPQKGGEKDKGR